MTLDIWLRRKRNTQSAYAFFKRLYKQFGEPKVIVTDRESAFDFQTSQQNQIGLISSRKGVRNSCENI